jgi:O-antigen/teichoic acid export membrane protein
VSKEAHALFNNFASLTVGFLFIRALNVITNLYSARMLGPGEFGMLSTGLVGALILSITANLGLDDYLVLAIARQPGAINELIGDAILAKTFVLPVALLGALMLGLLVPAYSLFFLILTIYGLLYSYILIFFAAFRGLERMEFQTFLLAGQTLLVSAGSIFVIWQTHNVTIVAAVCLIATLVTVAWGFWLLRMRGVRPCYRWRPTVWRQLIATALPFGLVFIYSVVYDRLPSLLMAALAGKTAAGWYSSAYNITMTLTTLPAVGVTAIFPLLARRSQHSERAVGDIATHIIKYTCIASLGLMLGLIAAAPWLIPFLFGNAYQVSVWILQVLAISLPFVFLSVTLTGLIEAVGHQRACARYTGYALVLSIPINLMATWRWGYQGGTIAYLVSNILLAGFTFWLAAKILGRFRFREAFGAPLLAGLGMALVLYLGRQLPLYWLLPLACCAYALVLVLSGALGSFELGLVRSFLEGLAARRPAVRQAVEAPIHDGSR